MKWIEIIELRSVNSNRDLLNQELKHLIKELKQEAKQQAISVYSHIAVDSDFSIHLLHNSNDANVNGSPLGVQLVSSLKSFGLVNHSVWVEMHSN